VLVGDGGRRHACLTAISPFTRPDGHSLQSMVAFFNKNTGLRHPS
jgi:hypothetical protein